MSDRAALFANVLNTPADDTARLVLADWLEEHGEDSRGRFLRAGVLVAQFGDVDFIDDPAYYAALAEMASIAKSGEPARWLASLGIGPPPLTASDWSWDNTGDRVAVRIGSCAGVFVRGLLTELEITLGEWYTLASSVLTLWPIEVVRATDVPGLSFVVEQLKQGWQLTGRVHLPRRNVPLTRHTIPTAIAPGAVLTHASAEWAADQFFADRTALVAEIAKESASIVEDLKDAAGDRWPSPPRR